MSGWCERSSLIFLTDYAGNYCPQISVHVRQTTYTRAFRFGIGCSPARAWFYVDNDLCRNRSMFGLHAYLPAWLDALFGSDGGMISHGFSFSSFFFDPEDQARRAGDAA